MSDVSFIRRNENQFADMLIENGDIKFGNEMESLITVALLTDARVTPDEFNEAKLSMVNDPQNPIILRGWWGDTYSIVPGNQIGSKFWLNSRQKSTRQILENQIEYAEDALVFMVEDGIASSIVVEAEWIRKDIMEMKITVQRPDASVEEFRYQFVWEGV